MLPEFQKIARMIFLKRINTFTVKKNPRILMNILLKKMLSLLKRILVVNLELRPVAVILKIWLFLIKLNTLMI